MHASAVRKVDKIILLSQLPKQPTSSSHQGLLPHALDPVFLKLCSGESTPSADPCIHFPITVTEKGGFEQDSPQICMFVHQVSTTKLVLWFIALTLEGHWQNGLFLPGFILLFSNYLKWRVQEVIILSTHWSCLLFTVIFSSKYKEK